MNAQIESAIKRSRGYWFVDGFTEMAAGVFFILLACLLLFSGKASPATFSAWFLSLAGLVAIAKLGGLVVAVLAVWWLKDHFTYPRTGYVRGQRVTSSQVLGALRGILLFLLAPVLALLAAALLFTSSSGVLAAMPAWFSAVLGLLWAVLLVLSGEWLGIRRFRILAGLTLLVGLVIATWQLADGLPSLPSPALPALWSQPAVVECINRTLISLDFLVLTCGAMLLLSGFVTFVRYRRENPSPYAEDA